jgi:hypothetical protein
MLSFKKTTTNRPIAYVSGGIHDKKIIYINNNFLKSAGKVKTDENLCECGKKFTRFDNLQVHKNESCKLKFAKKYIDKCIGEGRNDNASFNELHLDDGEMIHLPNFDEERNIWLVSGPSGCGKSLMAKKILHELHDHAPKKKSFYISSLDIEQCKTLKGVKYLDQIDVDDEFMVDPFTNLSELENTVVVFDDADTFSSKNENEIVDSLLKRIIKTGRHFNINCVITRHLASEGKKTADVLNECKFIVLFPKSSSKKAFDYVLDTYIGIKRKHIQKLWDMPTQYVIVHKNAPQYIVTDSSIFLPDTL